MASTLEARPEDYPEWNTHDPVETLADGEDFDSSNVHSLLYDFGERELIARFYRDGVDALYQYPDFPANEWSGLAAAGSKGGYINREIVGVYRFNKLRISRWPSNPNAIPNPQARLFVTRGITAKSGVSHPHF